MLTDLHVMGDYWQADAASPTELGRLVAAAKDHGDEHALRQLEAQLSAFVLDLDVALAPIVAAVPPGPGREAHPVPSLAACVAEALDVDAVGAVLTRAHETPRLRDTPAERRRDVVIAAGYEVNADVRDRDVVLVDDVLLTGTTLRHLAELLTDAGASSVVGVVAARTRLAGGDAG
ncbi:MAG: phosphoribosyltransferase family protein [Actinomycetota bacterium]